MGRANLAKARARDIIERLNESKTREEKVKDYLKQLKEKYSENKISYSTYVETIHKKTDGRNLFEHVELYRDEVKKCKDELARRKKNKRIKNFLIGFFLIAVIAFLLLTPAFEKITNLSFTGFVTKENSLSFSDQLNLVLENSSNYEWTLKNPGKLNSISLSGLIEGDGEVKIYLDNILIFEKKQTKNSDTNTNSLTGNIIEENSEPENQISYSEETEIQSDNPSSNEVNKSEEALQDGTRPSQEESSQSSETNQSITQLVNSCTDNCKLKKLDLNKTSYQIRIELSNATLYLNEINYEIISEDISEENITEENITEENITEENATITTTQYQAKIGEPVKWKKIIILDTPSNITIDLPKESENIIVNQIPQEVLNNEDIKEITLKEIELYEKEKTNADIEIKDKETNKELNEKKSISITGNAVSDNIPVNPEQAIQVSINENSSVYEIEYETPAPYVIEQEIERGKRVEVVGPETVHYENVLSFTSLNENLNITDPSIIKIHWIEENSYITPNLIDDLDNNGIYDYIEWLVPHLSNQTFEIIIIIKAEHLNSTRGFISNIYQEVRELDGIFSETIPENDYVRVTFEIPLDNVSDITLYPRIISGNPRIEIYEVNESVLIAEFNPLINDTYNTIYLTNLNNYQDTFDLKIINGSIEFDHIIDPTILFVSPTPNNGQVVSSNFVYLNTTITDSLDTSSWFDWDKSLFRYWSFDYYNATHILDNSTYGKNGTFSGGSNYSNLTTGIRGKALVFNGSINKGMMNGTIENLTTYTISLWFKDPSVSSTSHYAADFRNGTGSAQFFFINWEIGNQVQCRDQRGNSAGNMGSGALNNNQWYHLTLVSNDADSYCRLYINGTLINASENYRCMPLYGIHLGSRWDGSEFSNISLDEFIIFNRSISADEIKALYNNSANRLYNNFTGLSNGIYNYSAHSIDSSGEYTKTTERTVNITSGYLFSPTECKTLSSSGYYNLQNNVTSTGTCFTISAENVTLDCNNYWINFSTGGANNTRGVYSTQFNTTVKNCNIVDGNWSTIQSTARRGIYFYQATNGTIENNFVNVSSDRAIYVYRTNNTFFFNNTGISKGSYGIGLNDVCFNNTLINNTAVSNTDYAFYLDTSSYNNLIGNNFTSSTASGAYIYDNSNYNNFVSNNIASDTSYALYVRSSYNNFTSNTVKSSATAIRIYASNYSLLENNTGISNTSQGITLITSTNNNLTNNFGFSNYSYGIYLDDSSNYNNVTNNTAYSMNYTALRIDDYSSYNTFINNNGTSSGTGAANEGIGLTEGTFNTFINNTGISRNARGIYCSSFNNTYIKNTGISINGQGLYLTSAQYSNVSFNTGISTSNEGIYIGHSYYSNITSNTGSSTSESNSDYGIYFYNASYINATNNTGTSKTSYGIVFLESSENNLTLNKGYSNSSYAILLEDSWLNTLYNNTGISNFSMGIRLYNSSYNNLDYNLGLSKGNSRGIQLTAYSNYNNLTNNNATSYIGIALNLYINSGYNTLINNTATAVSASAINLYINSSYNTLINNTGKSVDGIGLYMTNKSEYNLFINNTATSISDYGIHLSIDSKHNIFMNNFGSSNSTRGLYLQLNSDNNTFINHTSTSNYSEAINLDDVSNNTFINSTIIGYYTGSFGVYFSNANDTIFRDCKNISSASEEVYISSATQSINNTFINCSYEKEFISSADGQIIRKWYFDANVTYSNNTIIANANLTIYNSTSSFIYSQLTDSNGDITKQELIDYINTGGSRVYQTPHLVEVTKTGYVTNSTEYNITTYNNQVVKIILKEGLTSVCQEINTPGYYTLNNIVQANGTCFNITTNDVILDCDWNIINYSKSGPGYAINNSQGYDNITIKNCIIHKAVAGTYNTNPYGISISYIGSDYPYNNTIENTIILAPSLTGGESFYGIRLNQARDTIINNVTIETSEFDWGNYPIYIGSSINTSINNSRFVTNQYDNNAAMVLSSSQNITMRNTNITAYKGHGFAITVNYNHDIDTSNLIDGYPIWYNHSLSNQVVLENQNLTNKFGLVSCGGCTNVTYRNLTLASKGIEIFGTFNSTFYNINITPKNSSGLKIQLSDFNNFTNFNTSMVSSSNLYGPTLYYADDNNFTDLWISGASGRVINSYASENNTFTNLKVVRGQGGIRLQESNNTRIINSTIEMSDREVFTDINSDFKVYDTILKTGSSVSRFYLNSNTIRNITLFNVTTNNTLNYYFLNNNSFVYIYEYADVNVTYTNNTMIGGANLSAFDKDNIIRTTTLTTGNSINRLNILKEYRNGTINQTFNNYTINTSLSLTNFDWEIINITSSSNYTGSNTINLQLDIPSSCQILSTPNQIYTLTENVTSTGTCFTISAENITLDCNNYWINYSTSGSTSNYGVYANQFNTTIKNCNVVDGNLVTVDEDRHGIFINTGNNCTLFNNSVTTNTSSAILLESDFSNLTSNRGISGRHGIDLRDSDNNVIINNFGNSTTEGAWYAAGISISYSLDNLLINNTAESKGYGFYMGTRTNNTLLINNTAISYGLTAIIIDNSINNTFINQKAEVDPTNGDYAVSIASSRDNLFRDCINISGKDKYIDLVWDP